MTDYGYPFMFGLYGKKATRENVAILRRTGACGVLLLGRNIETAQQTRALTEELVQRVGRPLLFSIDHEGGWVLRFKSGVTAFPGNAALGRARDPKLAYAVGAAMGRELFRLGIHINLAPVLDVVADYNPGIGIRSFGADPKLAGALGCAMIRGLQDNGVSACAKHFPGKGAARVDAHVELPRILMPKTRFERVHLAPFARAIAAGVDCVMTSHVRFPKLDSAPATFSREITENILRRRLGFPGAIVSDDLCMGAVARERPIQLAAVQALDAGHDILLIAHDTQTQLEAAELLAQQAQDGAVSPARIEESCARIRRLFARQAVRPPLPDARAAERLSGRIAAAAVEISRKGRVALPLKADGSPPLVLVPDFSEVKDKFTFEGGPCGPEAAVKSALAAWGPSRLRRTPVESTDLGGLAAAVSGARRIVFLCFEARRFPGQRAVLELLKKRAPERSAVALIRGGWDQDLLSPEMTAVDAGGYRLASLRAALKAVFGLSALALSLGLAAPKALWAASSADLRLEFIGSSEPAKKMDVLKEISETAPETPADVHALFDLFARFPFPAARESVMQSLHRLDPQSPGMKGTFLPYFDDKEPESQTFAVNGALAVRDEKALPLIRDLAKQRFPAKSAEDLVIVSEKNQWWCQYEALSALAQWEGPEALPLLRKKARQAPAVARIMAAFLWKDVLSDISSWAASSSKADKEKLKEALAATVAPDLLRESLDAMRKLVRDPGTAKELRHQLAIRIGLCVKDAEVAALLKEIDAEKDPDTKLLLTTAVFASQSPLAVPLLKQFARESPEPRSRSGALSQLKGLADPADYRAVLEWAAKSDPDADNKADALRQLKALKKP